MVWKRHQGGVVILVWVLAHLLSVAAIGGLGFIFSYVKPLPGWWVSSLFIGLPIALAQWLVLRRLARVSILWLLTIPAGLILGVRVVPTLVGTFLGFLGDESVLAMTLFCTIIGLLVGLIQWPCLRPHFTKSWVWLLGSAAGLGLGMALILISNLIDLSGLASIIVVAVVYAIATGLVVSWLRASPKQTASSLANAA